MVKGRKQAKPIKRPVVAKAFSRIDIQPELTNLFMIILQRFYFWAFFLSGGNSFCRGNGCSRGGDVGNLVEVRHSEGHILTRGKGTHNQDESVAARVGEVGAVKLPVVGETA